MKKLKNGMTPTCKQKKADFEIQTHQAEVAAELLGEKTSITHAHVPPQSVTSSEPPDSQEPGGRCNDGTKCDEKGRD